MPTITIRGLGDDVLRALKVRAAREGRSMEAEVRTILTSAVAGTDDEYGFGTLLAQTFAGLGPFDLPPRADAAKPIDLS